MLSAQLGKMPYGLNDEDAAEVRVRSVAAETTEPTLQSVPCVFVDCYNRLVMWYLPGLFCGTTVV